MSTHPVGLFCPRCNGKLAASPNETGAESRCDCGGAWVTPGAGLERLLDNLGISPALLAIISEEQGQPSVPCPSCNAQLARVPLKGVEVDRCPGCLGIWFDAQELEKLQALQTPVKPTLDVEAAEARDRLRRESSAGGFQDFVGLKKKRREGGGEWFLIPAGVIVAATGVFGLLNDGMVLSRTAYGVSNHQDIGVTSGPGGVVLSILFLLSGVALIFGALVKLAFRISDSKKERAGLEE